MSMNSITKKYLVIMAILLCACQNHKSVILAKSQMGKLKLQFNIMTQMIQQNTRSKNTCKMAIYITKLL